MVYEFGDFTLDTRRYELRRAGEPQHLQPQVYGILCHLVKNRDRLVTKEELLDQVWGQRFITPGTLNSRLKALRQALDDSGSSQRVIQTVRGRGFRFVMDVAERADAADAGTPRAPSISHTQQIRFCRAADGVRIAYATSGEGPTLMKPANWLTHLEFDWESPVWRHWLTALGETHTLIRYDERGCGLSDHDVAEISFESWIQDLEAVVDAQGLERFSLLGISQGCAVAVVYAARHPERVDKLVLYGGYARGRRHRNRPQQLMEAAILCNMIRVGWGRDNPAFREVFGTMFLPEGTTEQRQWYSDLARTMPMENALRIIDMTHHINVEEEAAALNTPALVLHARGDGMVPFEEGCHLATLIRGARFVPLESRNHVLLESEPAWSRFLEEVRGFLA